MATNTLPPNFVEDIEKAKKLIRTFYRLWVASELSARFYREYNLANCEGTDTESEAFTALLKNQYHIGFGIGDELDNLLNVLGIKDLDYSSHRQEEGGCEMKLDTNPHAYPNKTHLEQLGNASNGIFVCANVVSNMLVERTLEDCPDWCESDYILGGLIDAIGGLSNTLYEFIEREEDKAEARKKDKVEARKKEVSHG